ncbi:MAG TPA: DUF962 domain-containing protein [Burkholderiaceae bacterium]|nr:DUF962 domain-containing protein [Burkholderiaceae bacterium]
MRNAQQLLTQYAAYHRDRRNIATHFVGVPLIVFAVGVLLAGVTFVVNGVAVTAAWIVFVPVAIWYLSRDFVLGMATSAVVAVLLALAHPAAAGSTLAWLAWGVGGFVVGWAIQFVGHHYEGRKPAFVDDLVGLLVGPMFVVAEWLFMLGWNRPMLQAIEAEVGPTVIRDAAHPA